METGKKCKSTVSLTEHLQLNLDHKSNLKENAYDQVIVRCISTFIHLFLLWEVQVSCQFCNIELCMHFVWSPSGGDKTCDALLA